MQNDIFISNIGAASIVIFSAWRPISTKFQGRTQSLVRAGLISFFLVPGMYVVGHGAGLIPSFAFILVAFVRNAFRGFFDPGMIFAIAVQGIVIMVIAIVVLYFCLEALRKEAALPANGIEHLTDAPLPQSVGFGRKAFIFASLGLYVGMVAISK